ncbi:GNAT family N-acetyltransferase [Allorhizobium undicola]|uniref:GNAT family N-acetyltransferase n=1 Tax=Allorhizobium undicola TaxID=78527 RepID=UPI0004814445|nr:GNAT family N-acetyltransferase [Allorhizobium undicola]
MNSAPSAPEIRIRPAESGDLSEIVALYRELNPDDDSLSSEIAGHAFAALLAHPGLTVFVGLDGECAVATATLNVIPNLTRNARPYAIIENVVCLTSHRGRGFGKAVVTHAIKAAWEAGCYKTMLLTGRTDAAVHRFYEGCGFVQNKTGYQIRR